MIYFILIIGFIVRVWNLNQSFWLDEAAQAIVSSKPLFYMLSNMHGDFHPPLFYIMAHFWIYLGKEEWVLRLLTLCLGLISIYVFYIFMRNFTSKKISLIGSLFLAINPFHVYYSQEFRPYIAACLFGLLSIYYFWNSIQKKSIKNWILFTSFITVFLYTTYPAVFLFFGFIVYLLLEERSSKNIKFFFSSFLMSCILFIPWLPQTYAQFLVSNSLGHNLPGWNNAVSTPVFKIIPLTIIKFIIGEISFYPQSLYFFISLILVSIIGFLIFYKFPISDKKWKFLVIIFSSTLLSANIFSFFIDVSAPKRLIFILPIFIALITLGLERIKRYAYPLVFVLIAIFVSCLLIYEGNPKFQREDWRSAVAKIDSIAKNNSLIIFKFSAPFAPYIWYQTRDIPAYGVGDPLQVSSAKLITFLNTHTAANQIFVFQYLKDLTDPSSKVEAVLQNRQFHKIQTFNFHGVGFVDYYIKY